LICHLFRHSIVNPVNCFQESLKLALLNPKTVLPDATLESVLAAVRGTNIIFNCQEVIGAAARTQSIAFMNGIIHAFDCYDLIPRPTALMSV
jgi:hypothetical protein